MIEKGAEWFIVSRSTPFLDHRLREITSLAMLAGSLLL
jgi:hypothetical protein